uniref:Uncharacterized protein n=1 Tax=Oryza barthii TaxID=65489 RepID=A0A0D3GS39_9ORYZ
MAQAMASMTGLSQGVQLPAGPRRAGGRCISQQFNKDDITAYEISCSCILSLIFSSGTLNSDQARDTDLPLKERFYLQPLPPAEAAARAKESAQDIINLKPLIEKKQWPFVRDDLRLRASYLRYDLKTVINSKPKDEKKGLKDLTGKLFATIDGSPEEAEKYYTLTKSALGDVLAKLG